MPTTYEPIATTTLGSAATTISFTSIGATYTDLRVVLVVKANANDDVKLNINSDTGTNYSRTLLYGTGAAVASARYTSTANITLSPGLDAANNMRFYTIDIFSYAGSTFKTLLLEGNGDTNGSGLVTRQVGLWRSTSAITQLDLATFGANGFAAGTTATLYGIKNA
jgi:hypothetical protein